MRRLIGQVAAGDRHRQAAETAGFEPRR